MATKLIDGLTSEEFLVRRFAHGDCDWCYAGAEGHEVAYIDQYGDPVVICIADREAEDREQANAARRAQMLGYLS